MSHDKHHHTKPSAEPQEENGKVTAGRRTGRRLGRTEVKSLALVKDSTKRIYHQIYKDIYAPGALDRRTKELIAIGVASASGCEGCLLGHLRKARALGVSMDEIKEAVGVAFSVNAATVVDNTDIAAAMLELYGEQPTPDAEEK